MNKAVFTICAKNYIGLALALESSILKHNKDVSFYVFVADEFSLEEENIVLPENVLIAKNVVGISDTQWHQMSFKYDITEFCTAIKPSCFKYVLNQFNPDTCIYFDPDILVFNSLNSIYEELTLRSMIVTPHITTIERFYTGNLHERNLLYSGMFNLGFLALRNDEYSLIMLDWWEERLKDKCFRNNSENLFTDQKWLDFLPSYFPDKLLVSSDLGWNVAPWNFFEREIVCIDDIYYVKNRIKKEEQNLCPLIFVHFSGFNYSALIKGDIIQDNIQNFEGYGDFEIIFRDYASMIEKSDFLRYVILNYSYNSFSDGTGISKVYRSLFRRLFEDDKLNTNPFDHQGEFYLLLKNSGIINSNLLDLDRMSRNSVTNLDGKIIQVNRFFRLLFWFLGPHRFFMIVRLMSSYSKIENHAYLIHKDYSGHFKIRS